jgi:SPP1 family phage portal protein
MGIKGIAYELLYADENANVRFEEMEPDNTFLVYDTKIIPEPFFGVRYFYIDEELFIEAYTKEYIYQWKLKNDTMIETLKEPHYFGGVPLIAYENNKRRMGDFEKVITLIDAIELATANSINDLEYFSDAYMYLINMMGTDSEDIKKMRSNRLILLDEEGEAGFLVKPSNGEDSNNIKDRLNVAIHKFSNIPDMSDENFASNASGVAMEYKHFGLDQVVANKERKFKTGLSRRLELICNFLNTKKATNKYSYDEIKMTFTRNKPTNEKENAEVANMLKGLVSDQTVMSHLFAVDDVNDELERIEAERGAYTPLMEIDDDEVDEVGDEGESLE